MFSFFFHDPATTDIYSLSLHDALPISLVDWVRPQGGVVGFPRLNVDAGFDLDQFYARLLEEHGTYVGPDRKSTRLNSSHVEISYAVFCLKKKKKKKRKKRSIIYIRKTN